jgi:DmsE family decaheme c-type cytochrome
MLTATRWGLLLALLAASQFVAPALAQLAERSQFAGSTVCKTCHADVATNFFKNPHYKSVASGTETPDRTGCEGCHGPGRGHADSMGQTPIARAFSSMTPNQVMETCLACHAKDASKANIHRSAHSDSNVVCTNCHSIHHSPEARFLLAKKQPEVCYGCHADIRAQFSMPFKHRVNEGTVKCTDCHNPHGTFAPTWRMGMRPQLVDQRPGNEEPCLRCHADKRGPFVFEHAGVRVDGCETCHIPHGTTNAKLLRRPVVFTLCLECHNGAGSFGRSNNGVLLQGSNHNMLDPRFQHCTTCHVRIHGSNNDPTFFR